MNRLGSSPLRRLRSPSVLVVLVVAALLAPASALAQDLEPRAYATLPVGLNFALAGYAYSEGGIATDPSLPLEDAQLDIDVAFLGYVRSLDVLGHSAKLDFMVPYAWLSGTASYQGEPVSRVVDGFADPSARFSINLVGGPALSPREFASYEEDLVIGASARLWIPLGQYDSARLVNVGTHRWAVKPEIGLVKSWGRIQLELASGVNVYSSNPDFFGGKHRDQDPLFAQQAHILVRLFRGIFVAADATYYSGGRTTVDGVENDDALSNGRLGGTLVVPLGPEWSVKLSGSTGMWTRFGSDFDTYGAALQYRWVDAPGPRKPSDTSPPATASEASP